jgi:hypothetical protein
MTQQATPKALCNPFVLKHFVCPTLLLPTTRLLADAQFNISQQRELKSRG